MATKDDPRLLMLRRIYKSLNEIRTATDLSPENCRRICVALGEIDQVIWRLE